MAQIYATFPGISNIKRARAMAVLGVYPAVHEIEFQPQASIPNLSGNLVLSDGVNSRTFTNCIVDTASLRYTTHGHIERIKLWDRRRLWRFTTFTGVYNERDASGDIIAATEKTPQQIAAILLDAMGEVGYNVAALPNTDRPFVSGVEDRPDLALYRLCVESGCDIALLANNTVQIVVVGAGASLPADSDVQSVSFGADNGEVPQTIRVCCGPTRYQCKILLEAVGLDTDGTVVPIDSLSYAPALGWGYVDPTNPLVDTTDSLARSLAARTVYRWYRVKWLMTSVDGEIPVSESVIYLPGVGELNSIDDILPISSYKLGGQFEGNRASITGRFVLDENQVENGPFGAEVDVPFQIDEANGIVMFSRPVYRHWVGEEDISKIYPAYLMLETSFSARDPDDFQYIHYTRDYNSGGSFGTHVVKRPDFGLQVEGIYDTTDLTVLNAVTPTSDNQTATNALADATIAATLPEFATYTSHEVRYVNIKSSIDLDGAIRQVMFLVNDGEDGRGGANTIAARNCEPLLGIMRRREARYRYSNETHQGFGERQIRSFKRTRRR